MLVPRCQVLPLAAAVLWIGSVSTAYSAIIIDTFDTSQSAANVIPFPPVPTSVAGGPGIIGGERDFDLTLLSGPGATLQANFGGNSMLEHGQLGSSTATSLIVWDGPDGDASTLDPTGLGGVDLTDGGTLTGILLGLDVNDLVAPLTLTAYTDAGNFSSATVILPGGVPPMIFLFVPFLDFVTQAGTGADFTNIGALSLFIDGSQTPSLDVQLDLIAASNPVPEPATFSMAVFGALSLLCARRRRRKSLEQASGGLC